MANKMGEREGREEGRGKERDRDRERVCVISHSFYSFAHSPDRRADGMVRSQISLKSLIRNFSQVLQAGNMVPNIVPFSAGFPRLLEVK